ncbi:MAG TPA: class I SAM-dependent methyltransferase [Candidatus Dojkabacteria bacterium]|nr:class I SAM-dependent methyltransferase [Candidatus Dojkabacteria bacterium]
MKVPSLVRKVGGFVKYNVLRVKRDPKAYSTIVGAWSMIPCQYEAYFLCMNKYVKKEDKVLDVGFGLGYGMNILSIKAKEVHGVDIDQKVLNFSTINVLNKNPKVKKLSLYDGYHINYPDNYFDVVTSVDVLEHVEDYHRFLDELLRVSKRGVFISTPNRRPEFTKRDGTPKNPWHLREWSYAELNKIVKKHGKVEWNFENGPFRGPFTISNKVKENTLTLTPFIFKKKVKRK